MEADSEKVARAFVARYTRKVHDVAPTLAPVVIFPETLSDPKIPEMMWKKRYQDGFPVGGLCVPPMMPCLISGSPAERMVETISTRGTKIPISQEIWNAREAGRVWHNKLLSDAVTGAGALVPDILKEKVESLVFPLSVDAIVGKDGTHTISRVALIAADLNDLGDTLRRARDENPDGDLPAAIREIGRELLVHLLTWLISSVSWEQTDNVWTPHIAGKPDSLSFALHEQAGPESEKAEQWALPFRPLVWGGDDIAFICDQRIAFEMVEAMLSFFDSAPPDSARHHAATTWPESLGNGNRDNPLLTLSEKVGIACVPYGYSLTSARESAEALLHFAKDKRTEVIRRVDEAKALAPDDPPVTSKAIHGIAWNLMAEATDDLSGIQHERQSRVALRPSASAGELDLSPLPADLVREVDCMESRTAEISWERFVPSWKKLLTSLHPDFPNGLRSEQTDDPKRVAWAKRTSRLKAEFKDIPLLPQGESFNKFWKTYREHSDFPEIVDLAFHTSDCKGLAAGFFDQLELIDSQLSLSTPPDDPDGPKGDDGE